jgi:hypothetical protein
MTQPPPKGQMYLFDSVTPPLDDGSYRITAGAEVTYKGRQHRLSQQHYFNVIGPRFAIPQAMVAGTFPPANGYGAFQDDLPQIVLSRRTLPWERALDPQGRLPAPVIAADDPPALSGPVPWVALLVFEEGEYTLLRNIPLEQAVNNADVFRRLGSPQVTCDAVEADLDLVKAILPSIEELQLLAHVRWVNVDDRELSTAGGDGYYAVVVANRLPSENAQCRAILVSLEERSDLVRVEHPPVAEPPVHATRHAAEHRAANGKRHRGAHHATHGGRHAPGHHAGHAPARARAREAKSDAAPSPIFGVSQAPTHIFSSGASRIHFAGPQKVRLVALTSWQFTCEGPGTFRDLMQKLDVGMLGKVGHIGHPAVSDTGHVQLTLQDRLGDREHVWYRSPLVQCSLSRDNFVYHSADQARRVTPETGAEDISYAAAFELGRLLGARDARFAQALMRWRREMYQQSARADTLAPLAERLTLGLPATLAETLHSPILPMLRAVATEAVVQSKPSVADAYGYTKVHGSPGLNGTDLAAAWNLTSPADASVLLGADAGTLGAVVPTPAQSIRDDTTLSAVAADRASLDHLSAARTQAAANAEAKGGGA